MNLRPTLIASACATLLTPVILLSMSVAGAQMMESENFRMESDSVNVGGGHATSENFQMEDTVGEVATGESDSESFQLRAGFQQMQTVLLSMSEPDAVLMAPSIPGVAGGFSYGSSSVTVITDSPAGYEITIETATDPALQADGGADTIADYTPTGDTDFTFTTEDTDAHLGYTVESVDAVSRFYHDGASCGSGGQNTGDACWTGLSTTPLTIVSRPSSNHPDGDETTVHFRVGVGGSVVQPVGVYTATTTLTALPL